MNGKKYSNIPENCNAHQTEISHIRWREPWYPVESETEQHSIQIELLKEISPVHPLWGTNPVVLGRHQGCDDVLLILNEGQFAIVHLTWTGKFDQYPDKYPSATIFDDISKLQKMLDFETENL
ncbi:hypothetical protein KKF97_03160 [Myxococcota bacterium]|nr:hypothetical protein [Myxococcota bacterium]MBU1379327.1 hypothetical protein [Myxococcota bacterium]